MNRDKVKHDLSILIAAHTEDVYFNPSYCKSYIDPLNGRIEQLMKLTQFDEIFYDDNGKECSRNSLTPPDYLLSDPEFTIFNN